MGHVKRGSPVTRQWTPRIRRINERDRLVEVRKKPDGEELVRIVGGTKGRSGK